MEDGFLQINRTLNCHSDPSFAKKYLTKKNYFLGSLHSPVQNDDLRAEVERKNEDLKIKYKRPAGSTPYRGPLSTFSSPTLSHREGCTSKISISGIPVMAAEIQEDFSRPPDSSDEEENFPEEKQETNQIQSPSDNRSKFEIGVKRKAEPVPRPSRFKHGRHDTQETLGSPMNNLSDMKVQELPSDNFLDPLNSSQGRRMKGKAKTFTSSQRSKESFSCPDPLSQRTPQKQANNKKMVLLDDITKQSPSRTPKRFKQAPDTPQSHQLHKIDISFQMPDDFDMDENDCDSPGAKSNLLSNNGVDSPRRQILRRHNSSSSLSSIDSLAEYQLSKQEKEDLMDSNGETVEIDTRYQVRCSMCKRITTRSGLGIYENLSALSLKTQQKFCYKHRLRDAQKEWQRAAYPQIDWEKDLNSRIQDQKSRLSRVLRREEPSYYLDVLDAKMKEAKGNQSQIKRYFDSGLLDVVHQGYYGPRGSKIFANAIANDEALRKLFDRQSRSDRAVRIAGFARFIDSVLLPEMILRLVMEDMATNEEKAREILRESTEVGILLHPGDDYVVRNVED